MSRKAIRKDQRGYFGVGIYKPKNQTNYGTLFRSARIFGAAYIFTVGARFKPQCSDTQFSHRHMPAFDYRDFDDFNTHRPYDCVLVGIEMGSRPLEALAHPQRAIYLLGAEDHGLPPSVLGKCQAVVTLPGDHSLNVAVAGSIVLYDRIAKLSKAPI